MSVIEPFSQQEIEASFRRQQEAKDKQSLNATFDLNLLEYPIGDAELDATRREIRRAVHGALLKYGELKRELDARETVALKAKHKSLRAKCRLLRDALSQKTAESQAAEALLETAISNTNFARNELAILRDNPVHPNSYPTDEELSAYEQEIIRAKAKLTRLSNEVSKLNTAFHALQSERDSLLREFNVAAGEEIQLRSKLYPKQKQQQNVTNGLLS